jgi:hypothetical protein
MISGPLSSFSRSACNITLELYDFVTLHRGTDLDVMFGFASQAVKILDLGPVLDAVEMNFPEVDMPTFSGLGCF